MCASPEAVMTRSIVIWARVRVPVLSEAITEAAPSVSTDDSFLTMALWRAMRCTPSASTTERMAGRPSGTAATASDTPSNSTCITSAPLRMSNSSKVVPTTTQAMLTTPMPSMRPMRLTSCSSGVFSSGVAASIPAMAPISVAIAQAVTSARPEPWTTVVPMKTMLCLSPRAAAVSSLAASLRTAALSPVSDASSICSELANKRRASAATASPSASITMSPRTMLALATRMRWPSRTTAALGAVNVDKAATASWAFASCK